MNKKDLIPSRILELELEIKLLEYLKVSKAIDEGMYNYSVNRILNKITIEKNKINLNMLDYRLLT